MCRGIDCVLVCPRLRCCCCCTCCTCTHSTIDPSSRTMGDLTLGSRDPGQAKGPILSVSRDMIRETMSLCVLAKRKKGSWFGYFAHEASGGSKSCTRPMDGRSCLRTIRNGARCTWSKLFLGVRMHYIHTVQYSTVQQHTVHTPNAHRPTLHIEARVELQVLPPGAVACCVRILDMAHSHLDVSHETWTALGPM
jgi:hypothetical protein